MKDKNQRIRIIKAVLYIAGLAALMGMAIAALAGVLKYQVYSNENSSSEFGNAGYAAMNLSSDLDLVTSTMRDEYEVRQIMDRDTSYDVIYYSEAARSSASIKLPLATASDAKKDLYRLSKSDAEAFMGKDTLDAEIDYYYDGQISDVYGNYYSKDLYTEVNSYSFKPEKPMILVITSGDLEKLIEDEALKIYRDSYRETEEPSYSVDVNEESTEVSLEVIESYEESWAQLLYERLQYDSGIGDLIYLICSSDDSDDIYGDNAFYIIDKSPVYGSLIEAYLSLELYSPEDMALVERYIENVYALNYLSDRYYYNIGGSERTNVDMLNAGPESLKGLEGYYLIYHSYPDDQFDIGYTDKNGVSVDVSLLSDEEINEAERKLSDISSKYGIGKYPDIDIALSTYYIGRSDLYSQLLYNNNVYDAFKSWPGINGNPVAGFILSAVIFIFSVISLIILTGRKYEAAESGENEYKNITYPIDKVPYDIAFICGMTLLSIMAGSSVVVLKAAGEMLEAVNYENILINFALAAGSILTISYIDMSFIILSLVRHIKHRDLWKNLLIGRILIFFWGLFKRLGRFISGRISILAKLIGAALIISILIFIGAICAVENYYIEAFFIFSLSIAAVILSGFYFLNYEMGVKRIIKSLDMIKEGGLDTEIDMKGLTGENYKLAERIRSLKDDYKEAVIKSVKDERFKTELITNVSHDIKTPLTSIITYVDLLKKEDTDNENIRKYIDILDIKSERLRHLILDLIEASKASSGNIELDIVRLNISELLTQAAGEFRDKFCERDLTLISDMPDEPVIINGDGRRMFRIIENLLQNAYKYSMPGSRIYMSLTKEGKLTEVSIKNISELPLNMKPAEFLEKFSRGDKSRNTDGTGLGLSIAKSLTELQGGKFDLTIEGDLFKVTLRFPGAD